jgi:hypothetical protein
MAGLIARAGDSSIGLCEVVVRFPAKQAEPHVRLDIVFRTTEFLQIEQTRVVSSFPCATPSGTCSAAFLYHLAARP